MNSVALNTQNNQKKILFVRWTERIFYYNENFWKFFSKKTLIWLDNWRVFNYKVIVKFNAAMAQSVERVLGKDEVGSSSLLGGSISNFQQ